MSTGSPAKYKSRLDAICRFRYQQGFSLLEILVAFSILAMALGVLYQIFSQGSRSAILTEEYTRATLIAESRLAEFGRDTAIPPRAGQGMADNKYHWIASSEPYAGTEASAFQTGANLYDVGVHVTWESLGQQHQVELRSLRLVPEE